MSELPKGWVLAHITDMLSIRNGYAFKSSEFCETGIPVIRQSELRGEIVDISRALCVPNYFLNNHRNYIVTKGDVLIGMSGSLGKVSLYVSENPALQNQRTGLLQINETVADKTFSLYALKYVEPQILAQGKGVAVQNVSSSQIESCESPLPPRAEQTRIVAKLEELLSDLDAGVTELKAAQKKLKQYRQSLLKAAVEGALTADWRTQHTPTETGAQLLQRILSERRTRWEAKQLAKFKEQGKAPPKDWQKKYPEPVQPDTTNLPELPEGWVWTSVEQLTDFITSGSRGWADYYADVGATFIRAQNINKDWLDLSDTAFVNPPIGSEGARTRVQRDDVLLTITGANVGKAARVETTLDEAYVSQHVALIRLVEASLAEFLHLFLTANSGGRGQLNKEAYGAGKPGLNLQQVAAVSVPLAGAPELHAMLKEVAVQLESAAASEAAIMASLKQSAAQRQNILRAAFAGQLVPQDPTDEPASVLLERIRAERAAGASKAKPRRTKERA